MKIKEERRKIMWKSNSAKGDEGNENDAKKEWMQEGKNGNREIKNKKVK